MSEVTMAEKQEKVLNAMLGGNSFVLTNKNTGEDVIMFIHKSLARYLASIHALEDRCEQLEQRLSQLETGKPSA